MYHQFNIQQLYVLPTQCILVFCMDLRTNRGYFPIQHKLNGFYDRFNILKSSGYYMYHQINSQQFYVLPTRCICVFCMDLRTNRGYFPIQHKLHGFYDGFNPLKSSGHYIYHQINSQQFYVLPTRCVCVFCMDLKTNRCYFCIQHKLHGF